MDINDLDDDFEEQLEEQHEETSEDDVQGVSNHEESNDIVSDLLKDRGIDDINKIKFEEENGTVVEKPWSSLTKEEQRNILNQSPESDPESNLDDSEIEMLNQMRLAGMTPEQYVTALRQQGANYVASQQQKEQPSYKIDDLTDEELYVLDLQYRSPEMTDEEMQKMLTTAMSDEGLFNKTVSGLRNYYKALEQEEQSRKDLEIKEQEQQQFNEYSNKILNSIQDVNSVGNMDIQLSDDDREELAEFILGRDKAGINWFGKALEDPDTVVRMAWFALKGEDAFNDIESYISQQIKATAQNYYNKGLQDAKKSPKVVVTNPTINKPNNEPMGLESIDF